MTFAKPMPAARCLIAILTIAMTACVYRINIQQGNFLENDEVEQVEVGMTRNQVRFLLGTPLVNNPFDDNLWEYYYYFKVGKTGETISRRFTVYFDGDVVERIDKADIDTSNTS